MAKQPYIPFYLGDYIKDTRVLPLNVKGGWVDLMLAMWDNEPRGELTGSIDDYARIMNCGVDEANLVIQTLKQKKIFDYHAVDDVFFKIVSRKQKKMKTLSETRKTVGKLGGNPILLNQKLNLNTENEYSINVLTVKTSENGKKSENGYSGNFKARGEEVMAKRLREGIEAANKAGGIDSGGEE